MRCQSQEAARHPPLLLVHSQWTRLLYCYITRAFLSAHSHMYFGDTPGSELTLLGLRNGHEATWSIYVSLSWVSPIQAHVSQLLLTTKPSSLRTRSRGGPFRGHLGQVFQQTGEVMGAKMAFVLWTTNLVYPPALLTGVQ